MADTYYPYPVVLVNISRNTNAISFPMGLSVVANSLLLQGVTPQVIDLVPVDPDHRREEFLRQMPKEPAIYGFSLMIGNRHLDATEEYARLVLSVNPENRIVYGGSLPSSIPEMLLEKGSACHYVVHGEGEVTFYRLVQALRMGDMFPENVSGIFYRKDGKVHGIHSRRMRKLDHLSNLNFSLFDVEFYVDYFREVGHSWEIMASRGCRAHCTFCYKFMGDGISFRSVGDVLDEISYIMDNYDIRRFYFVDENFLQYKKYFLQFIEEKNRRGLVFDMYAQSRIDEIDDDRCRIGVENGLQVIGTGIESVSPDTLQDIQKKISIEQAEEAIARMKRYGIRPHINLIIGFPSDTEESYKGMLDFIERNALYGQVKLHYLTPLPSTVLYEDVKRQGLIVDEFEYIRNLGSLYWNLVVNLTNMPDETLHYYYQKISDIGKREFFVPKSERYTKQMNELSMYKVRRA